jgi:hypothetical protein
MSSRQIQYFALPDEIQRLVGRLRSTAGLEIVSRSADGSSCVLHDLVPAECFNVDCRTDLVLIDRGLLNGDLFRFFEQAAILGSVHFEPCRMSDNTLWIGRLAAKNEWLDMETKELRTNPNAFALYVRVKKAIDVWADTRVYGAMIGGSKRVHYKQIKCTEGARAFFGTGGKLGQWGVRNVRFEIE